VSTSPSVVLDGVDPDNEGTFGSDVDAIGDVNRDGYGDLIVGHDLQMVRAEAYIYLGGPDGPSNTRTVLFGPGERNSRGFGTGVAGAGDVNADGYGDVIISSMEDVLLFLGGPGGIQMPADQTLVRAGGNLAMIGAGDVNGDGYADIASGLPQEFTGIAGWRRYRVYVHHGNATGLDSSPNTTLRHEGDGEEKTQFGWSLASLDVNGDGYWELAVGLAWVQQARIYYGGPPGIAPTPYVNYLPEENGAYAAQLGGGDVDGDGDEEFLVGASAAPYDRGRGPGSVYLYRGDPSGATTTPTFVLRGTVPEGAFGAGFCSAMGGG
jgi:hypothetical protein